LVSLILNVQNVQRVSLWKQKYPQQRFKILCTAYYPVEENFCQGGNDCFPDALYALLDFLSRKWLAKMNDKHTNR
jgi:hypothetical protein